MENISGNVPSIRLWGKELSVADLTSVQGEYLSRFTDQTIPLVEWVWGEMDRVWNELQLDSRRSLKGQKIGEFYSHPIWILNGVFTATDPVSVQNRKAIAATLFRLGVVDIADYGGGFGELAKNIHAVNPDARIDIVEPFPSKFGANQVGNLDGIRFTKDFKGLFDCVVAQDVLEHIERPLELAVRMVNATKPDGFLIFANCFSPVIKCHLPSTFYLRHTFSYVAQALGLTFIGRIDGADYALIFKHSGDIDHKKLRRRMIIAKAIGPVLNILRPFLGNIKRMGSRK